MQGDSPSKASSPKPATSPDDNKPPSTKGRGRPTSDGVRIPWQVLKLAGSSASTTTGCGGGSSATAGGSGDDQVKKPVEEGSSRKMGISHKRKHSQTTLPAVSPTKSPVDQQEAPHDDHSPASGGDDITAVKNSCEEKAKMEACFAVVSGKEKIEVEPSKDAKGKNIEEPCADADADADEDLVSSEAFAEEKYVDDDDDESCDDDDVVTSKINKGMFLPVEDEEKKEIVGDENSGDEEKKKNEDETFEADNNKGEKDKKEAFETVAGEKKHEAAEKRKMKFPFDLNELPSGADDDEDDGVVP